MASRGAWLGLLGADPVRRRDEGQRRLADLLVRTRRHPDGPAAGRAPPRASVRRVDERDDQHGRAASSSAPQGPHAVLHGGLCERAARPGGGRGDGAARRHRPHRQGRFRRHLQRPPADLHAVRDAGRPRRGPVEVHRLDALPRTQPRAGAPTRLRCQRRADAGGAGVHAAVQQERVGDVRIWPRYACPAPRRAARRPDERDRAGAAGWRVSGRRISRRLVAADRVRGQRHDAQHAVGRDEAVHREPGAKGAADGGRERCCPTRSTRSRGSSAR